MAARQLTVKGADGRTLCVCALADRPLTRLRGLLGRRGLGAGEGLLIKPAPSIHTFFMRFAIDAVFLDRDMTVVGVAHALRPWRMAGRRGARQVLELAAGAAREHGLRDGERLQVAGDER